MGFGYLLLGYLVANLLYLTVSGLGIGGLALLLGYTLMLLGLRELTHYESAFVWAKWALLPMAVLALYDTVGALDNLFFWNLPLYSETAVKLCESFSFVLTVFFNFALLYAIKTIATKVGIGSMAVTSTRNAVFVGFYAILAAVSSLPVVAASAAQGLLSFATYTCKIIWVACNLLLLLACNKNICRKGDEEQAPRRSRFKWLNKMDDFYEKNKQQTIDSTKEYAEEVLRRRRAEREKKRKKKK